MSVPCSRHIPSWNVLTITQAPSHGVQGGAQWNPMQALSLMSQLCGVYFLSMAWRVGPSPLFPGGGDDFPPRPLQAGGILVLLHLSHFSLTRHHLPSLSLTFGWEGSGTHLEGLCIRNG